MDFYASGRSIVTKLKLLDLFSGIGGFSLGLERAGFKTVAFCEIDESCQAVLKKHWSSIPIHSDIREVNGKHYPGIDLICGGFPCQDISTAGRGQGLKGSRSGLWREFFRIIKEAEPRYVIIENVANLRNKGLEKILQDIWSIGYNAEWYVLQACQFGFPHKRARIFIIAYTNSCGRNAQSLPSPECYQWKDNTSVVKSNAYDCIRSIGEFLQAGFQEYHEREWRNRFKINNFKSPLCRVNHGLSRKLHKNRLKQIGNSVIPQIVEVIGRAIIDYDNSSLVVHEGI